MSAALDRADDLAEYLATVDGLQSVTWLVDRERDLGSEFTKATQKKHGLGVIAWAGGVNRDRDLPALRLGSRYTVTLFFKPLVRGANAAVPADLTELAARAIHHWFPDDTPTKRQVRFEVTAIDPVRDEMFTAFRISAESIVQCSSTAIPIIP